MRLPVGCAADRSGAGSSGTIPSRSRAAELARMAAEGTSPAAQPEMQKFLAWIAGKPADFHAPTRSRK